MFFLFPVGSTCVEMSNRSLDTCLGKMETPFRMKDTIPLYEHLVLFLVDPKKAQDLLRLETVQPSQQRQFLHDPVLPHRKGKSQPETFQT